MEKKDLPMELINFFSSRVPTKPEEVNLANVVKYVESIEAQLAKEEKCNQYLTKIIEAQKELIQVLEDQITKDKELESKLK